MPSSKIKSGRLIGNIILLLSILGTLESTLG